MNLHAMFRNRAFHLRRIRTKAALELEPEVMVLGMSLQVNQTLGRISTILTLKGTFILVDPHVGVEIALLVELVTTKLAFVVLLVVVMQMVVWMRECMFHFFGEGWAAFLVPDMTRYPWIVNRLFDEGQRILMKSEFSALFPRKHITCIKRPRPTFRRAGI